jgi:hypothetical protein
MNSYDRNYYDIKRLIGEELDQMKKAGIIDVVGINENGDWLYTLSKESKKIIDDLDTEDAGRIAQALMGILEDLRDKE